MSGETKLTPKQAYDERRRLRRENDLRREQRAASQMDHEDDVDQRLTRLLAAFERVADVLELWADRQESST